MLNRSRSGTGSRSIVGLPGLLISLVMLSSIAASLSAYASEAPLVVSGAKTIDAEEAKYLYDSGALFLDVRGAEEWTMGHVNGAIHLDLAAGFEALFNATTAEKATPIVIYCNSSESLRAAFASAVSVQWGYSNVYFFRNGYYSWMASDFPVYLGFSERVKADFIQSRSVNSNSMR